MSARVYDLSSLPRCFWTRQWTLDQCPRPATVKLGVQRFCADHAAQLAAELVHDCRAEGRPIGKQLRALNEQADGPGHKPLAAQMAVLNAQAHAALDGREDEEDRAA